MLTYRKVHIKSKEFACYECGHGFPRKDSLQRSVWASQQIIMVVNRANIRHKMDGCAQRSSIRRRARRTARLSALSFASSATANGGASAVDVDDKDFMPAEKALRLAHAYSDKRESPADGISKDPFPQKGQRDRESSSQQSTPFFESPRAEPYYC